MNTDPPLLRSGTDLLSSEKKFLHSCTLRACVLHAHLVPAHAQGVGDAVDVIEPGSD